MTPHVCTIPKTLGQCPCGQWYDQGKAIAAFVARALQEKHEAEAAAVNDDILKDHTPKTWHAEALPRALAFRVWVADVHQGMFTSAKEIRAMYWTAPSNKSYVAIGSSSTSLPPMVAFQATSMCVHGGVFGPTGSLVAQRKNWDTLEKVRSDHGYALQMQTFHRK